jgi:hypothetical protein
MLRETLLAASVRFRVGLFAQPASNSADGELVRWRESRHLITELRHLGIAPDAATEICAAVSHGPTRRRPRATVEVAVGCASRLVAGEMTVDGYFLHVWGIGVDQYFEPLVDPRPGQVKFTPPSPV